MVNDRALVIFPSPATTAPRSMFHTPSGLLYISDLIFGPPRPTMPGPPPHQMTPPVPEWNKLADFPSLRTIYGGAPMLNGPVTQQS
jgi:hypothetical protein